MIIKLMSENDVTNLRPLPFDVSPRKTSSYIPSADEVTQAEIEGTLWKACFYNGRLYRVRSADTWETKH